MGLKLGQSLVGPSLNLSFIFTPTHLVDKKNCGLKVLAGFVDFHWKSSLVTGDGCSLQFDKPRMVDTHGRKKKGEVEELEVEKW